MVTNFGLCRVPADEPTGVTGAVKDEGHERSMPPEGKQVGGSHEPS